jgi:AraC-like DNA-binding protein
MRSTDMPTRVFSTVGLPEAQRVELWESHNATALIGLAVHATTPLTATERNLQLATVHLARVSGTAHAVERPAGLIRRDPADAIVVYLSVRGDSWFRHDGGTEALRPGSVVACDADRPFARGFARGLEELVVRVPRQVLASRAGRSPSPAPLVASFTGGSRASGCYASDCYARALARMAGRAMATRQPVPADEDALLDLVAVLMAGRQAAQAVAHRAAAKSYIEDHLTDPGLGAEQVAHAIGISTRQLSRVFAVGDTSIPRHILARRLTLAYSLLARAGGANGGGGRTGADVAGGTVADVAARCGFTSATYFSHAFAEHFGQRASEVRPAKVSRPLRIRDCAVAVP